MLGIHSGSRLMRQPGANHDMPFLGAWTSHESLRMMNEASVGTIPIQLWPMACALRASSMGLSMQTIATLRAEGIPRGPTSGHLETEGKYGPQIRCYMKSCRALAPADACLSAKSNRRRCCQALASRVCFARLPFGNHSFSLAGVACRSLARPVWTSLPQGRKPWITGELAHRPKPCKLENLERC